MLKKTITYTNFNDEEVTEDFFFHLSMAELTELELSHQGGLKAALDRIIAAEDGKGIVEEFKNIILTAFGKKSLDGKRFVKNDDVREEFKSTGAYSALFMELVMNADKASEFINGIVPQKMVEEAARLVAVSDLGNSEETVTETEVVTRAEANSMSQEQLQDLGTRIAAGTAKIAE